MPPPKVGNAKRAAAERLKAEAAAARRAEALAGRFGTQPAALAQQPALAPQPAPEAAAAQAAAAAVVNAGATPAQVGEAAGAAAAAAAPAAKSSWSLPSFSLWGTTPAAVQQAPPPLNATALRKRKFNSLKKAASPSYYNSLKQYSRTNAYRAANNAYKRAQLATRRATQGEKAAALLAERNALAARDKLKVSSGVTGFIRRAAYNVVAKPASAVYSGLKMGAEGVAYGVSGIASGVAALHRARQRRLPFYQDMKQDINKYNQRFNNVVEAIASLDDKDFDSSAWHNGVAAVSNAYRDYELYLEALINNVVVPRLNDELKQLYSDLNLLEGMPDDQELPEGEGQVGAKRDSIATEIEQVNKILSSVKENGALKTFYPDNDMKLKEVAALQAGDETGTNPPEGGYGPIVDAAYEATRAYILQTCSYADSNGTEVNVAALPKDVYECGFTEGESAQEAIEWAVALLPPQAAQAAPAPAPAARSSWFPSLWGSKVAPAPAGQGGRRRTSKARRKQRKGKATKGRRR